MKQILWNNLLYIYNDKLYRYKSEEIANVKETDNILNIPSSYILQYRKMSSNKQEDEVVVESKKFQFHLNIQLIHQALCMSGHMFKLGSLFEHLLFNDPTEYVLLNDVEQSYSKLKREYYVWYGQRMPRQSKLPPRTKHITKFKQLQQLSLKLKDENVTIMLFYNLQQQYTHTQPLNIQILVNVHLFPVNEYHPIDKYMKQIGKSNSGHKEKNFLPNFYELSSDIKSQINKQKFNLYWMLAGQNIVQAYLDFYQFFKYFLNNENVQTQKINEELQTYQQQYQKSSFMRTSEMEILFYTKNNYFHKIINNSLRTFTNPEDFAYIRFPFLRIFLTVNELFITQKEEEFRKNSFYCYRGSVLAESQIKLLLNSVNKYVQITTFFSTSMRKQIAQSFGADLIIIEVPPVFQCTSMFHSFASIKHYSNFFAQDELLFNPLNIFMVQQVKKQDDKHIIHLKYINVEALLRKDNTQLSKVDRTLIQSYTYQKQMLNLNRNQGEYLWRLQKQQNATKYYQQKFKIHLKATKPFVEKEKGPPGNKILTKYLYEELKIFLQDFQWFENEQKNLKLVDLLLGKNTKRSVQLYLYTSKIYEFTLNNEKTLSYLLVSGIKAIKIVNRSSSAYYLILSCLGLFFMNLDQIEQAKCIFQKASQNLTTTYTVDKISYIFVVIPAVLAYQTGAGKKRKQMELLLKKCIEKMQPYNQASHPWLKFIQRFEDIKIVKQFIDYYTEKYDKMLPFMKRQIMYATQEILLQVDGLICQSSCTFGQMLQKEEGLKQKLSIAAEILEKAKPNCKSDLPFIKILIHTVLLTHKYNQTIQISKQFLENWQRQEQRPQKLNSLSYYQFRLHLISLRYILKINHNLNLHKQKNTYKLNPHHFLDILQILTKKFRNNYYLHLLFLIDVCQFCAYRNYNAYLLQFLEILKTIQQKVGQVLNLHLNQISFLKKRLAQKIFHS